MYNNNIGVRDGKSFPDPLASHEEKATKEYGLKYAKAIESQWGSLNDSNSAFKRRHDTFRKNRKYANGTQDTTIYKKLLTALDPNGNDGTLLNMDFTPVPILPKFSKIVVNNILSKSPYPNVEAIDPLSSSYKDIEKKNMEAEVLAKEELLKLKQSTGMTINRDPADIPDTLEEAEIFAGTSIKTDAEVAAQIGINMTLEWNEFTDTTYRRCVEDLVVCGMAVVKRDNDPNYGITTNYVDPVDFVHSYTEDPNFSDIVYGGHVKKITIQELKRLAGDQLDENQYQEIAKKSIGKHNTSSAAYNRRTYNAATGMTEYGYDSYIIEVLDFEFLSVDPLNFEEKTSRHGNKGFYYKGLKGNVRKESETRKNVSIQIATVYGGSYILGCGYVYGYGLKKDVPRNQHELSRARLSYSISAVNLQDMIPKSIIGGCLGFADMLQLTHLKIQQAIAKAKPDGLIIDIEGLENVQLGKGGELQPLELHDIYEQTGVFYYRSKNPEGGFQNPPIREIGNSIRNINELVNLYNHYLRLIRDSTGINEVMDATSPNSEALVGVRDQAIKASNNATFDVTNCSMLLYKRVCDDIVRCLQILPPDSKHFKNYQTAIGESNMKVLSSFSDLSMFNFGVKVVKNMDDKDKAQLEQMLQISLGQKEIDLEDALAIRDMKDVDQAERLLMVRRKKRKAEMKKTVQQAQQVEMQKQQQQMQMKAQMEAQKLQMESQLEIQKIQAKAQAEVEVAQATHELRKEIEQIKIQASLGFKTDDKEFREKLEVLKEDRKDDRVKKQAVEQSKLMSQRKDRRGELIEEPNMNPDATLQDGRA